MPEYASVRTACGPTPRRPITEYRTMHAAFKEVELRDSRAGGMPTIVGYTAVFNKLSTDLGGFREKISPGAFTDTLANDDQVAMCDHDPGKVLGRKSAGTLTLREDADGVFCEIQPPDNSIGRDTLESVRRGDLRGMSFGFNKARDSWTQEAGGQVRTIKSLRCFDVSLVAFPAYPQTTAAIGGRLMARSAPSDFEIASDARDRRLRLICLDAGIPMPSTQTESAIRDAQLLVLEQQDWLKDKDMPEPVRRERRERRLRKLQLECAGA
jgi:HK97 family phage prohead protease